MDPTTELTRSEVDRLATLQRRGVFQYHDGFKTRFGDRLAITIRLQKAAPNADIDQIDVRLQAIGGEQDPDAPSTNIPLRSLEALDELQPIITTAFGLAPFCEETGAGLTSQERLELLGRFISEADVSEPKPESDPRSETEAEVPEAEVPEAEVPDPETDQAN